jgi:hypothetical protein
MNETKEDLKGVFKELHRMNSLYSAWDEELDSEQKRLVENGMEFFDALKEVSRMRKDSIREGRSPVDFDELNRLLDELCLNYLTGEEKVRSEIRDFFHTNRKILRYLHGYIGRNTVLLRSEKSKKWIRLAMAAVSICDRRVDWRDLLVILGGLYFTAKEIGINPTPFIKEAARISSTKEDRYGRSTKNFVANFTKTGYYRSLREKWLEKERRSIVERE